jgi:hypothetical protein
VHHAVGAIHQPSLPRPVFLSDISDMDGRKSHPPVILLSSEPFGYRSAGRIGKKLRDPLIGGSRLP